jgi:hypothetical protein
MAAPLLQKKMRFEFEFDVAVEAIDEADLSPNSPIHSLATLKALQAALLADQPGLLRVIQARLISQLQAYTDNLAGQDAQATLNQLEASLDPDGSSSIESQPIDFDILTYPIRVTCLSACLTNSTLLEEQTDSEGAPHWQTVWSDLRMQSPFGQWIKRSSNYSDFQGKTPQTVDGHYFVLRYLERRIDTTYAEASCTCGLSFSGSGVEESEAIRAAWEEHHQHLGAFGVGTDPMSQALMSQM